MIDYKDTFAPIYSIYVLILNYQSYEDTIEYVACLQKQKKS